MRCAVNAASAVRLEPSVPLVPSTPPDYATSLLTLPVLQKLTVPYSCRDRYHSCLQGVWEELARVNQSLAQMQEISSAWPLASNISTTIVSGTLYDEQLPAPLNRVWSR